MKYTYYHFTVKTYTDTNRYRIPKILNREFTSMRNKYITLFNKIKDELRGSPLPLTKLKVYFERFGQHHLSRQVTETSTNDEIVEIAFKRCTLIDVKTLEGIVLQFNNKKAEDYIREYERDVGNFRHSISVRLCLEQTFEIANTCHLRNETATFVLDWDPDGYVLQDIEEVLNDTLQELSIFLKINLITDTHSIDVTCNFPLHFFGSLIAKVLDRSDYLLTRGFKKIEIGYCQIWEKEGKINVTSQNQPLSTCTLNCELHEILSLIHD